MGKYDILASNIKKYRSENSLTQKELAEKIHKKEITVRKYESGTVKIPFNSLLDMCRIFKIKPIELFKVDGELTDESGELLDMYEVDEDVKDNVEKFFLDPHSYDFINNIKEGRGDTDSLISSIVLFYSKKHNINITLDDFNMYDEILLRNLIENCVVTFLKTIRIKNMDKK
jgi:transcriptional regulator with XRE-family HTH domain